MLVELDEVNNVPVVWLVQHYTDGRCFGVYSSLIKARQAAQNICALLGKTDEWDEWDDNDVINSDGEVYEVMYSNQADMFHICRWALDRSYDSVSKTYKQLA